MMTYATLYDIRGTSTDHNEVGWPAEGRSGSVDAPYEGYWSDRLDGDTDDDISAFFGGTVHIYSLGNSGEMNCDCRPALDGSGHRHQWDCASHQPGDRDAREEAA